MKKIRILHIVFDEEIREYEVAAFRGAIIHKAGEENTLFHNHLIENGFRYKYPLIQYKTFRKNPAIVCIDEGVDEIHHFFGSRDWSIDISGRSLDMEISKLNLNQFNMQVWESMFEYKIYNWVPFNPANLKKYMECDSLTGQIEIMENILKANILSFAKGIDWTLDKNIQLKIRQIDKTSRITLKGVKMLAFNLVFKTNVFLPNYIGLGKSPSMGFGKIVAVKQKSKKHE